MAQTFTGRKRVRSGKPDAKEYGSADGIAHMKGDVVHSSTSRFVDPLSGSTSRTIARSSRGL